MKTTLEIQNLKCGGCANTIKNKLDSFETLSDLDINNDLNTVSFTYGDDNTLSAVKEELLKLGYPVVGDKNALTTKAKSFVSCAIGRLNS
jgi:copper chaperone CopZ